MSRQLRIVVALSAASLLALLLGYFGLRRSSPEPIRRAPPVAAPLEPPSTALTSPRTPQAPASTTAAFSTTPPVASTASPVSLLDEASLMAKLRELRSSNPQLTLELARQGSQRFPDSPDQAERAWFIVKALTDLGQHDEARVEGRALLDQYRDSRWAEDVYRHLFVNPPTHPFERGYGKQLESDR